MSVFHLHFFKEKSRKIDVNALIEFFDRYEEVTVEMDEESVRFLYQHPRLGSKATFYITRKSNVPNIYRLNPKFLDLNFRMDIPIITSDYGVEKILNLVKNVVNVFDMYVYSEAFEDVLAFKAETVLKAFALVKEAYFKKYPEMLDGFYQISKTRLNEISRYIDESLELQLYYKDLKTYVPKYVFYTTPNKSVLVLVEWQEGTLTVFPPSTDYILLRQNNQIKELNYNEFLSVTNKFLLDVPGFLKDTKVIVKKNARKVFKLTKKHKFTKTEFDIKDLKHITYQQLID
ncbi:Conserved hypothetical protein [Alteracholeplasma palmae J233]|uniref:Uncharacterized protein n=1 Tax=Alteracholeplasma palmae (strain ATCC 49389 / J233) TaxID=1318466 RepID=U4KL43_ALTPJ|nr:hypothetical protein [Alteracholeplasma palmae]CCV64448.1 Conserved hypothetical protein [Alteracholeplasma palmae J233]